MLALTLWQPWCSVVAAGHKPVENRPWRPPVNVLGQRIALHAGLRYDDGAVEFIAHRLGRLPPSQIECPRGAVLAVATVAGCWGPTRGEWSWYGDEIPEPDEQERAWTTGPWAWALRDVVAIDPVPCRGAQRLWRMPDAIATEVTRRAAARRSS